MSYRFRRGAAAAKTTSNELFEASLLPSSEKKRLCIGLLEEFGARNIRESGDGELIHSCCLPFGLHKNGDANPSASLNYQKLVYNCRGCVNSGGFLWFIATCRGEETEQARRWVNSQAGLGGEEQSLSSLMAYFDEVYTHKKLAPEPIPKLSERVLEPWMAIHPYMTEVRGVPVETLMHFKVGYGWLDIKLAENHFVKSERVVIPHFWKGHLAGWQTRRLRKSDETPKYVSSPGFPKDTTLFNYNVKNGSPVVVESPMSVLSKSHIAYMNATFGAAVTDRQVKLLSYHPRVYLWFDNDDAGWRATHSFAERAAALTQVFVVPSPYAADPADMDDDTFRSLLEEAVPYHLWEQPKELIEWDSRSMVSAK